MFVCFFFAIIIVALLIMLMDLQFMPIEKDKKNAILDDFELETILYYLHLCIHVRQISDKH